ncbi:MAG: type I-C CRISPR-associated protein Cas7/Csd2 [Thermomicrobiales bacterium]|nr:type I-C CRISPR-associated protein Cas7/Csd2 [Thermomicrobiales bacterium]
MSDGNPNGDPDAGNLPRVDPETMQGLVTDVAIKRKIRDWVDATRGTSERFKIYVQGQESLNSMHQRAYSALGLTSKGTKQNRGDVDQARAWMCENFFDIRTFGAVMSTGVNAGQVRGPVQITFARSFDPITPLDLSITRIAITKTEDMGFAEGDDDGRGGKRTEMGRKSFVPYGLYRAHLFVNPAFGEQTGFDNDDLAVIWEALERMWDLDRSASRGMMACRGLLVFSHDHKLGNAPAHKLFDRVHIERASDVAAPRSFADYSIVVDESELPDGVTLTRLV